MNCVDRACLSHERFNSSLSGSYKYDGTPFSIQYGTGSMQGMFSQDTLRIGNLEIKEQVFAESLSEPGNTCILKSYINFSRHGWNGWNNRNGL